MTRTASPVDQMKLWLDQEIWPEIHAMMHNDGYFRLWLKAQERRNPVRPYRANGHQWLCDLSSGCGSATV
jgi:hypothetical protein